MKKVIVIDNYDSFTYNLVHEIQSILGYKISVRRNDEIGLAELMGFEYIFISPGPGIPAEAGITLDCIKHLHTERKIFGVCLGMQAIAECFGGKLKNLKKVYHGIETFIHLAHDPGPIFNGISSPFKGGRYHSWAADENTMPQSLIITCTSDDGEIMGVQHETLPCFGVQFHPESIMTPEGGRMIENFLNQ